MNSVYIYKIKKRIECTIDVMMRRRGRGMWVRYMNIGEEWLCLCGMKMLTSWWWWWWGWWGWRWWSWWWCTGSIDYVVGGFSHVKGRWVYGFCSLLSAIAMVACHFLSLVALKKCQTLRQIYLLKRMTLFWLNSVVRWMVVENRKEKIGEKRMSIVGFEPTLSRTRTWVWRLRPHAPRLKYFKFPFMRQISNFLFISFIFYMGFRECQKTSLKIENT